MDMEFNVAQLMKEPVGAKRSYDFGTPELLLSPALAPRLLQAGVDRAIRAEDSASDHAPAWIVLR